MNNRYIQAQCQNMLAVITAFSQVCELAAREDDGEISKAEARSLRSIHAASRRFQSELLHVMELQDEKR